MTFSEAAAIYFQSADRRQKRVKELNRWRQFLIDKYVMPKLGSKEITEITIEQYEQAIKSARNTNDPHQIKEVLDIVRAIRDHPHKISGML